MITWRFGAHFPNWWMLSRDSNTVRLTGINQLLSRTVPSGGSVCSDPRSETTSLPVFLCRSASLS